MISDLPKDLAEEVFSRIPITSLRKFRLTCKNWNNLSKDESLNKKRIDKAKAKAARELVKVIVIDFRVYLIRVDLANPSIKLQGTLVSLYVSDRVGISLVYHCDGLLLCITRDFESFVVWNPYTCQTRWFKPRNQTRMESTYAIGYDKNNSFKVVRFVNVGRYDSRFEKTFFERVCEIYELNSDSCKDLDISFSGWEIKEFPHGVSLKGNTYYLSARETYSKTKDFLICFDFTRETFGPRLGMPIDSVDEDRTPTLSSIREEQLAVLYMPYYYSDMMEIWVTTRIEPQVVAWSKFLAVDLISLVNVPLPTTERSFFIDQEKKIAVVFDKVGKVEARTRAYIIGEDGYFREIDLEEYTNMSTVACSYVPSLVHIEQRRKRKRKNMVTK